MFVNFIEKLAEFTFQKNWIPVCYFDFLNKNDFC